LAFRRVWLAIAVVLARARRQPLCATEPSSGRQSFPHDCSTSDFTHEGAVVLAFAIGANKALRGLRDVLFARGPLSSSCSLAPCTVAGQDHASTRRILCRRVREGCPHYRSTLFQVRSSCCCWRRLSGTVLSSWYCSGGAGHGVSLCRRHRDDGAAIYWLRFDQTIMRADGYLRTATSLVPRVGELAALGGGPYTELVDLLSRYLGLERS